MLENAYFFWKKLLISSQRRGDLPPNPRLPPAAEGSAPRLPRCVSRLLLQLYRVYFLR